MTTRQIARERGVDVRYEAMDATDLPHAGEKFDLVMDTNCLQNIVLDDDQQRMFAAFN